MVTLSRTDSVTIPTMAGGIRTLEEAQTYLELGADRIGSSGLVALVQAQSNG